MSSSRTLASLTFGVALGIVLALSVVAHGGPNTLLDASRSGGPATTIAYVGAVNAALQRYDIARGEGIRLLTARDANPFLSDTTQWRQAFGRVVQEHQLLRAELQSRQVPSGATSVQACLADGFRLTVTGEELLASAFQAGGHQAYYLSAHGNWDLNLGDRAVARCRGLLAAL